MAQPPEAITNYVITSHAAYEMGRRGLSQTLVDGILAAPEQRLPIRPGRVVFQSRVPLGADHRVCLPPQVVSAYATTKLLKYWKEPA